jgi:hypothetical protein
MFRLKMESQARIEQDDGSSAVSARWRSSRQLGVIDNRGSVERESVVVLVRGSMKQENFQGNTRTER